jgi:thiamine-monophosphate kinase
MGGEFDIIRDHFTRKPRRREVLLGVGDDAALLQVPPGCDLALTTDTLVAGRHFADEADPADIGWKALAVSLSDLAAMGAEPAWFTLALTLPRNDPDWLRRFSTGLFELAQQHSIDLVGGDTTQGPLSISIQAHGLVPAGQALRRTGAVPGDLVCVTGTLGDAALALAQGPASAQTLQARLHRPTPRVAEGIALRGLAHAAIDLSDGLAADLGHVLRASGVGAMLDLDALPVSEAFSRTAPPELRLRLVLSGGDDYELCTCLPEAAFVAAQQAVGGCLTAIGQVVVGNGLELRDADGNRVEGNYPGYDHFRDA